VFIVRLLCFSVIDVLYVSLQYFDTVGWVFWPVKTVVARVTYTVLVETLNPAQSINQTLHSAGFTDLSDSSKHVTTSAVEISFTLNTSKIQG